MPGNSGRTFDPSSVRMSSPANEYVAGRRTTEGLS